MTTSVNAVLFSKKKIGLFDTAVFILSTFGSGYGMTLPFIVVQWKAQLSLYI